MRAAGITGIALAIALITATTSPAYATGGRPEHDSGREVTTFDDDFLFDLCGITTTTTLTEQFHVTTFPDGSELVHVTRTYVSADPRIPIEKGAGTTHRDANGVETVTGTPIHLIGTHGTVLLDAGRVTFGDELDVRGPHPSLSVPSLAPYYCP